MPSNSNTNSEAPDRARGPPTGSTRTDHPPRFNAENRQPEPITPHASTRRAGKVERFHWILLEEWAYIRDWTSDDQRRAAYDGFIHFYNHHRSHGALGWATPASTLRDNLPTEHN